ncbi:MAG: hypothetical protein KAW88_07820 [Candidatus Cloacimonetes bacterium]|nr:hypothetical protein [Candidatus Cloacimonadota bacterium]
MDKKILNLEISKNFYTNKNVLHFFKLFILSYSKKDGLEELKKRRNSK